MTNEWSFIYGCLNIWFLVHMNEFNGWGDEVRMDNSKMNNFEQHSHTHSYVGEHTHEHTHDHSGSVAKF